MIGDQTSPLQKISKIGFFIAVNGILRNSALRQWINMLEQKIAVDAEGNLPPKIIGALYLMLHSSLGTEFVHPQERVAIRELKKFLDPYLEDQYRPQTDEPPPAIYLGEHHAK